MKKLNIEYKLISALSHIGETQGIDAFLNTQKILKDGEIKEVVLYTGNAIRGQLRDCGAKRTLQGRKVDNDLFYLLFSGGNIAGNQQVDLEKARTIREKLPLISILGGGIGNALLSGKIYVSDAYPLCEETIELVPADLKDKCKLPCRMLTSEREYTRFDDSKKDELSEFRTETEQKDKAKGEASTQMRYSIEVLNAGSELYSLIQCEELNDIEYGCLLSSIQEMFKTPYLGGKKNVGLGRFQAKITVNDEVIISVDEDGMIVKTKETEDLINKFEEYAKAVDLNKIEVK